jgi:hypothetical protein
MSMPPQQRPPGWQQGPWPPQPPPPLPDFAPDKKNTVKWLLIAVAVLLVVAVTIGATLYFTRDNGGGTSTTSSSVVPGDIASANDTGPVAIITEDPTCDAFIDINDSNAKIQPDWESQRRTLGPAAQWTADQRSQVQTVSTAMRNSADKVVDLAKRTPHRVMRELYEQYIVYARAYADSVNNYVPGDNFLASADVSFGNTVTGICNSITAKSANRSLALEPAAKPESVPAANDPNKPAKVVSASDATCGAWISNEDTFLNASTEWQKLDTSVPGSQWTPEQRATQLAAYPLLTALGSGMGSIGAQSGNPTLEDFGTLGELYLKAYVSAGESYLGSDSWLSYTGLRISNAIVAACHAAEG